MSKLKCSNKTYKLLKSLSLKLIVYYTGEKRVGSSSMCMCSWFRACLFVYRCLHVSSIVSLICTSVERQLHSISGIHGIAASLLGPEVISGLSLESMVLSSFPFALPLSSGKPALYRDKSEQTYFWRNPIYKFAVIQW